MIALAWLWLAVVAALSLWPDHAQLHAAALAAAAVAVVLYYALGLRGRP